MFVMNISIMRTINGIALHMANANQKRKPRFT